MALKGWGALTVRPLFIPFVLALCAAAWPASAAGLRDRLYDPGDGVLVVAHRGCHRAAPSHGLDRAVPENSLAALERCVALGVDLVEIDVRRTRDGRLIVMHDAKIDRTTTGKGRVAELTLAELQALSLKGADGEAPPTLEAVLRAARGRFGVRGPGAIWYRVDWPLVEGHAVSQAMRAVVASDFCNGTSAALDFHSYTFLNADLTLNMAREPVGDWILLDAESWIGPDGAGLAMARLGDARGYFGRVVQSLVIEKR